MVTKLRHNENELQIFADSNRVIIFELLITFVFFVFGFAFIYKGYYTDAGIPFLIGGAVFAFSGLALLVSAKNNYKKMKLCNGFVYLSATENGLLITPNIGLNPKLYRWSKISKIVLTKLFIDRSDDWPSRSKNTAIIYLQNLKGTDSISLIERKTLGIRRTLEKNYFVTIDLPKKELSVFQQKLKHFSQEQLNVEIYSKVEFNYEKNKPSEVFIP